jgi:hypothetical protein
VAPASAASAEEAEAGQTSPADQEATAAESELDESLEESFPSSDPPSSWAGPDPDE